MTTSIDDRELIDLCSTYLRRVRESNAVAHRHERVSQGTLDVQDRIEADIHGSELVRLEIARRRAHTLAGMRAKGSAYLASLVSEGKDFPGGVELIESLLSDLGDQKAAATAAQLSTTGAVRSPTTAVRRGVRPWVAIPSVAAVGIGALLWLGPPAERLARDQARSVAQQSSQPPPSAAPEMVSVSPAALPPLRPADSERAAAVDPIGQAATPLAPLPGHPMERIPASLVPATPADPAARPPDPVERQAARVVAPSAPSTFAPADAARGAAQNTDRTQIVVHVARAEDGNALAQALASRAALAPNQVDSTVAADMPPRAIIRYGAEKDHAMARRLGQALSQMGYAWKIESAADRTASSDQQTVDVWLPRRAP